MPRPLAAAGRTMVEIVRFTGMNARPTCGPAPARSGMRRPRNSWWLWPRGGRTWPRSWSACSGFSGQTRTRPR